MNRFVLAAAASVAGTATAMAGGLDRSNQNINILFEDGNYAELSFGYVSPTVDGTDVAAFGGRPSGDVADSFLQGSLSFKQDLNDQLSFALIADQPYGANVAYPTTASGGSVALGGTTATLDSSSLTWMMRYKFTDRFSVHGGLRAQQFNGAVRLGGLAYGGLNGYSTTLDGDTALGYQVGAAYEIPEIALRVAMTYFSEIDHDVTVTENGAASSNIEVTTPEAINLSFQTGIAEGTLLFGSFRYADYSVTQVRPVGFSAATGGASLTQVDKVRDYTLGIGRRFTDKLSGSATLLYNHGGSDDLVSPLAPTNGSYGITLAASYQATDQLRVSGGVNYTRLGDAFPETGTPDTARASFDDNSFVGVGIRIGYSF
ncbi:MAG: outer membrane protein transport protein [Jannaschia sp.]